MPYTSRTRNRYQLLVATATGVTACAAGATTGAIAAVASQAMADEAAGHSGQEGAPAGAQQRDHRPVVWKKRPHRTEVTTRVLPAASSGVVTVGGGAVTRASTTPATSGSGGSSGSGSSGGSSGPGPAPEPAPSSGS